MVTLKLMLRLLLLDLHLYYILYYNTESLTKNLFGYHDDFLNTLWD